MPVGCWFAYWTGSGGWWIRKRGSLDFAQNDQFLKGQASVYCHPPDDLSSRPKAEDPHILPTKLAGLKKQVRSSKLRFAQDDKSVRDAPLVMKNRGEAQITKKANGQRKHATNGSIHAQRTRPYGQYLGGAVGGFELAVLDFLLALDAIGSPRKGFQPFLADFFAAVLAFTKGLFVDAVERLLDHLQLQVLTCALAEEHFTLVGGDGEIGRVLNVGGRGFASLLDGRQHGLLNKFALLVKFFDEWARGCGGIRHSKYS